MTNEKPVRCGCGGEAKVYEMPLKDCEGYSVQCNDCRIATFIWLSEAEAIQAWNKAMGERTAKVTRKPEAFFYRCECGYGLCCEKNDMNFCPNCGVRLEWE